MQALRIPSASKIPDQFEEAKIISAAGPAVQEHFRRDDRSPDRPRHGWADAD
jgi:hypothetical protein